MVWPHAWAGCRCDDMDLVGMCCPAHTVCLPTSPNACTARNTATLHPCTLLFIVLLLPACTVRSGIAQCTLHPPSRPTLHQRHEQHRETSSALVVHFAPGTRLTLSKRHGRAGALCSTLCLLNIGLWSRYSEPRVCLASHFHTISSSYAYFLEILTSSS